MTAAKDNTQATASVAQIQGIKVSDDASRVIISTDSPLTYTSYKIADPPKIVIDLAQAEPAADLKELNLSSGNIKNISLTRQGFANGVLTRIEISLNKDVEFTAGTDSVDKGKLIVSLEAPRAEETHAKTEPAVVPPPVVAAPEMPVAQSPAEGGMKSETVVDGNNAKLGTPAEQNEVAAAGTKTAQSESVAIATPAPEAKDVLAKGVTAEEKPVAGEMKPVEEATAKTEANVAQVVEAKPEEKTEKASGKEEMSANPPATTETPTPSVSPTPAVQELRTEGPAVTKALTGIKVQEQGIDLVITGGADSYKSFRLIQPERLVIDIPATKNASSVSVLPINNFGISKARIGISPERLRVVFDAAQDKLPQYEIVKGDQGLTVRFSQASPATASSPTSPAVAFETTPVAAAKPADEPKKTSRTGKGQVEAIDFSIVERDSRIAIKFAGACVPGKPVKVAKGFSLSIANCQIPKRLQRSINTKGFSSPISDITPYQVKTKSGYDTRILVKLHGKPSYVLKVEADTILWDIRNPAPMAKPAPPAIAVSPKAAPIIVKSEEPPAVPVAKVEPAAEVVKPEAVSEGTKKVYKGRKVTLEFSDADIRKIFQLIAEVSNLNFLIADDVTGTISIKLVNVPWDQALDVILETKNLDKRLDGNIMYIKPKGKFKDLDQEAAERRISDEKLLEMKPPRVFEVNYAAVAEIKKQFEDISSSKVNNNKDASVISDSRTNRLIVVDNEKRLKMMEDLLAKLDTPEKQVMIEARIVEASNSFTRDLGVQWGAHYTDGSASLAGISRLDTGFGGIVSAPPTSGTSGPGAAMGMSFGRLANNIQLDLRLSAAASIGQVKIISTPKIVTLNNKSAKISQGQSIPYQTTSAEGTKTEFVEAALTLDVTPHITADGSIGMKIRASNNSPGSGTPPPINKKEATTELLVKNNETTVIGGIYVDSETETDTGVPFFQEIPLLGWLFKSNAKQKTKTELLIFITPKIVG